MGIILKSLGDYAVEETNLVRNYVEQGLSQDKAVDKALDDSYLKTFKKGAKYDNIIHFSGITNEDAFDLVESVLSGIGTTEVLIDKDNLIQHYLMVLFQEPDDYSSRLGIEAKIIDNDPSYAKLRFASTLPEGSTNQKIVDNLMGRVNNAFAPYIVQPGARKVDADANAKLDELLRRTSDNIIEPRAVFNGGTEDRKGVYIVPSKGSFHAEYSIDTFNEVEIYEVDIMGFKVVDVEPATGTLDDIKYEDGISKITLKDVILGPGKGLELFEADLKAPEDYSTMIMQYIGNVNNTQFTKPFESDYFFEGGRVGMTKFIKVAFKASKFIPYVNKVTKALGKD